MPLDVDIVLSFDDFNLAVEDGTTRNWCPGVGFAGSSGGALRLFFGKDETGGECKTSL